MACTIVSTPATGAADWTGWITQQGLTDRGFMRVSLTEFETSAASLIGTGSVFELAGSIYSCSDAVAIGLATGTASAAVAVYYVAIPSAGGTVCTFVMDDNVPTWVDAKQGYYASAASTSRYLGGVYIATAATYYNKWIYSPDMIASGFLQRGETRPTFSKTMDIGEWNMSANSFITITHGLYYPKIISVTGAVFRDNGDGPYTIPWFGTTSPSIDLYFAYTTNTTLRIYRADGSIFESGNFEGTASTIANRGYVLLEYRA